MPLIAFVCLQVIDALTTVIFLNFGVKEGNPLVRWAIGAFARPEVGIVAAKVFALALGVFAWRSGRYGLLRKMNVLFAACVLWNVGAIALTACA